MLGSSTRTMLFLLLCIGLLSDNRYKVLAMRNREFFLAQTQEAEPDAIAKLKSISFHFREKGEDQEMLKNRRILEEVSKNEVKADQKTQEEQKNKTNDSFKSSKRRVRRGSDPIHNKAQPFS
ncbi:unnamed protein product [Microthlaspi erraticum]|uniref:CLAVATA3/ESR (CLE)-related protein 45 n=1 Tax=Microthlaspi erraticum TaxID=1685480 RepID=A0A6D2HTG6_9BRAS|nr:unnamed protein product [Microthlaspi erraticum]